MAKSGKVSSSFPGVGDVRAEPVPKTNSTVDFSCGNTVSKAKWNFGEDSRARVSDNDTKTNRWKMGEGSAKDISKTRKSHSFGSGPKGKKEDSY